uniref:DUF6527 family protein n=1 Tax=Roseihalotalea indica TaxID=2867963 RepID=A0AA49JHQ9_9BACT|nr:DUF6527 family protein [Tunicatimonas sp. TK19036]
MLQHRFVETIPDHIEEGVLYISVQYCTAIHRCVCGCGNEVVTPLSPTDWKLTFDGKTVSLNPSIGNWNFECQSHYWIKNNTIEFAGRWTEKEISLGKENDLKRKMIFFEESDELRKKAAFKQEAKHNLWKRLLVFLRK